MKKYRVVMKIELEVSDYNESSAIDKALDEVYSKFGIDAEVVETEQLEFEYC